MPAVLLRAAVPHGIHMHRRHLKWQGPQHQLFGNTRDPHKVARQHGQQVGVGHHPAGCEKLVDGQHHLALAAQRGQRLIDEAVGPA